MAEYYDYKFEFDLDYSSYYYLRLKNEETPPEEFLGKTPQEEFFDKFSCIQCSLEYSQSERNSDRHSLRPHTLSK